MTIKKAYHRVSYPKKQRLKYETVILAVVYMDVSLGLSSKGENTD
jgi:hypothetical protein